MSERLREPQTFPGWSSAPGRGHCEPRPRVGGAGAAGAKALPRGGGCFYLLACLYFCVDCYLKVVNCSIFDCRSQFHNRGRTESDPTEAT